MTHQEPKTRRDRPRPRRRWLRITLFAAGVIAALLGVVIGGYIHQNVTGLENGMKRVAQAGFTERQTSVDGRMLNYAEGPDRGPPS